MVLHASSKRLISIERAREIVEALPPLVGAVGLFVDDDPQAITATVRVLGLSAVQLHGDESPDAVRALAPMPVIKAVHVDAATFDEDLRRWREKAPTNLAGLLMDSAAGGSGVANDWLTLQLHVDDGDFVGLPPWIAAGGLTPTTVGKVVRELRPWAVDVSSGVEERPGEKSAQLMREFIAAVREADDQIA
jgi:phosphoribosylanthranilate isomerase